MPRIFHVDVAILGAGTAGLNARRAAQKEGRTVLMIDPGPFGTTCARVGCMPSKLLIAAADAAHQAAHASRFGVHTEVAIDGPAVLARVREERDRFVGFIDDTIQTALREGDLLVGRAEIVRPGELRVGEDRVLYQSLVIATGSTPFVPPPFRGLGDLALTNEGIFELEDLPQSLLVIGLGVIGLELGQAFHRLGVRTTLLGVGGGVGPLTDPDVLAEARTAFTDELDLHPDYTLESVERTEGGVRLQFVDATGRLRDETWERVLVAAGRSARLGALGVERLGVTRIDGAWPIDPVTLQLGDTTAYVAGDANGLHPVLHEAADDGRIAGMHAALHPLQTHPARKTPMAVVFSDPQIGLVGKRWSELEPCEAAVGEVDYGDQGRARVQAMNRGKVRIYGDRRTGRLLGAELFGPRVEHLSHLLAWAVQQQLTVHEALEMPFYHPVVEEGVRTALRDLARNLEQTRSVKCPPARHVDTARRAA